MAWLLRRLGEFHGRSGCIGEETGLLLLPGIEAQTIQ
jgi:hypothetical protein